MSRVEFAIVSLPFGRKFSDVIEFILTAIADAARRM